MIPSASERMNMFANFAPHTISSASYEDLEWTVCESVSSVAMRRTSSSASPATRSAWVKPQIGLAVSIGWTTVQLRGLHVDQLAAPCVGDSKLEGGLATIGRHDRIATVNDFCRGPREPGKDHPGRQCDTDDVEQRLDRHQYVRHHSNGDDVSISDRSECVDAEKKCPVKGLSLETPGARLKRTRSADEKRQREESIDSEIGSGDEG